MPSVKMWALATKDNRFNFVYRSKKQAERAYPGLLSLLKIVSDIHVLPIVVTWGEKERKG